LTAHPELAIGGHDEWQMHCQPGIRNSAVRWDVRAWLENRKECSRAPPGHITKRRALENISCAWASRQVRELWHALVPQEIGAPAARLVELLPLIERHTLFGIRNVRFKSGAVRDQNGGQLGSDVIGRCFNRLEPGKCGPFEELQRRDLREIH